MWFLKRLTSVSGSLSVLQSLWYRKGCFFCTIQQQNANICNLNVNIYILNVYNFKYIYTHIGLKSMLFIKLNCCQWQCQALALCACLLLPMLTHALHTSSCLLCPHTPTITFFAPVCILHACLHPSCLFVVFMPTHTPISSSLHFTFYVNIFINLHITINILINS